MYPPKRIVIDYFTSNNLSPYLNSSFSLLINSPKLHLPRRLRLGFPTSILGYLVRNILKSLLHIDLFTFICLRWQWGKYTYAMIHMWRSEGNIWKSVLFFNQMGLRDCTPVMVIVPLLRRVATKTFLKNKTWFSDMYYVVSRTGLSGH